MNQSRYLALLAGILLVAAFSASAQPAPATPEETVSAEQFSDILKEHWIFLKDQTDAFLNETASKGEFETTPEFEARVAQRRLAYSATVAKYVKDQKLDTREFGVLLKARLQGYNADAQTYAVVCSVAVWAPYDIPSLVSFVPTNAYVGLKDTTVGGYRTSRLSLKLSPSLTWKVDRQTAVDAKADEASLNFKVRLKLDLTQPNMKNQALLRIIPSEILLINTNKGAVYWRAAIR